MSSEANRSSASSFTSTSKPARLAKRSGVNVQILCPSFIRKDRYSFLLFVVLNVAISSIS